MQKRLALRRLFLIAAHAFAVSLLLLLALVFSPALSVLFEGPLATRHSSLATAQSTSASVSGRVTDQSNAVVPGAEVEIRNTDKGISQTTTTNSEGFYSFPALAPGHYVMSVHKEQFQTVSVTGMTLSLQDNLSRNFALKIGSSAVSVTVTADQININTTDGTVSTLVDQSYIQNMPLNGRSFQDLILLTPGVVTNSPQTPNGNLPSQGGFGEFSVNGGRTDSNYFTVDGVSANMGISTNAGVTNGTGGSSMTQYGGATGTFGASTALGTTQGLLPVDDLQEFRVTSSTATADSGRNSGGQFSFETKSGTNTFHGDAYDYLRNGDVGTANDYFTNYNSLPQPGLNQNDFGGALGGPLLKDKTFFFMSYEGLRVDIPETFSGVVVPDACMRGVAGACAGLYGACTSVIGPPPSGSQPCPSPPNPPGQVEIARAPAGDAALLKVVNAFPLPNQNPEYNSQLGIGLWAGGVDNHGSIDTGNIRIDQNLLNDKMRLFFRFSETNSSSQTRGGLGIPQSPEPEVVLVSPFLARTYTVGVDNFISNQWNNQLRVNYTTNQTIPSSFLGSVGGNTPVNLLALVGLSSSGSTQVTLPSTFGNHMQLSQSGPSLNALQQWQFTDTVSHTVGAHQFKFGVDYRRVAATVIPNATDALFGYFLQTSLQAGTPDGLSVGATDSAYPLTINFSAFAQDTWKVSRRLTLTYGLRWDVNPAPTAGKGLSPVIVDTIDVNPPFTSEPAGTPEWNTAWFNLAPRLGAAYVARDTPGWQTVVRGGASLVYDTGQQDGALGFGALGYSEQKSYSGSGPFPCSSAALNISSTYTSCANGSVASLIPTSISTEPSLTAINLVAGFYPHLQLPYSLQWNATVEQQLGRAQSLTISYVGNHAARLLQQTLYQTVQLPPPSPPSPNIEEYYLTNGLTADYNALQLKYQRRLARGLTVLGSYTWSHCIDYGSTDVPNTTGPAVSQFQRGNCDIDVRQNFSAALSYDLPNVNTNAFTRAVLSHWGVDDRFTARTGFPVFFEAAIPDFSVTGQNLIEPYYQVLGQPDYISGAACEAVFGPMGSGYLKQGQPCPGGRAINPCAFALLVPVLTPTLTTCPALTTSEIGGIAPRNALRGFGAVQMDLAIRREFHIYQKVKLQFRAEAFNLFNHPNFGYISTESPSFGLSTTSLANSLGNLNGGYQIGGPREMQFALKLIF